MKSLIKYGLAAAMVFATAMPAIGADGAELRHLRRRNGPRHPG